MSFRRLGSAKPERQGDPEAAFTAALRDLGRRDFTESALRARLRERGFTSDAIDAALQRCAERGYTDDDRTSARHFATLRDKGWGPAQIRLRLQHQGVSSGRVDVLIEETSSEQWIELAAKRLERKLGSPADFDDDTRSKAWRYLQYRGFSGDTIRAVINV